MNMKHEYIETWPLFKMKIKIQSQREEKKKINEHILKLNLVVNCVKTISIAVG